VFPNGVLPREAIRDGDLRAVPPEVRLHTGETIFVPGPEGDRLRAFCEAYRIPLTHRPDVWDLLLEPFVDTEFTADADRRTRLELEALGFDTAEITEIRARFGSIMLAYNAVLWDWVHLGRFDLLEALTGRFAGDTRALEPSVYGDTYWWAMEVAERSAPAATPFD
jgi:hypothetical protein